MLFRHVLDDEVGKNTQPQPVSHHGGNGRIVQIGVADDGVYLAAVAAEKRDNVHIKAVGGHEKFLPLKVFHRVGFHILVKAFRQHRHQRVILQRHPAKPAAKAGLIAYKRAVQLVSSHSLVYLVNGLYLNAYSQLRVYLPQSRNNTGQPMPRHAGKGPQSQIGHASQANFLRTLLQIFNALRHGAHKGQKLLPRRGKKNAAFASHKKLYAQLFFQRVHHMCKAGLGVTQFLRSRRQAAFIQGRQQGPEFFSIHC